MTLQKTVSEENAAAKKVADAKINGKNKKVPFSMDRVSYQSPTGKTISMDAKSNKPNAAQFAIEKDFKVQEVIPPSSVLTEEQIVERKYTTVVVTDEGELFFRSLNKDVKDYQLNSEQKTKISSMLGLGSGDELLELAKQAGSTGGANTTTNTSKYNK